MDDIHSLPGVLTADEVAIYLRVSKTTVCRWCKDGRLPAFRIGRGWRVQRQNLEAYIQQSALGTAGFKSKWRDQDPAGPDSE